jgi:hypothetical protein
MTNVCGGRKHGSCAEVNGGHLKFPNEKELEKTKEELIAQEGREFGQQS